MAMKHLRLILVLILLLLAACGPEETPQPKRCPSHTASLSLAASGTTLAVGEQVTVTATLSNDGCGMLGLPAYRLIFDPGQSQRGLELVSPESVNHSLGISAGEADQAEFVLRAVRAGEVRVRGTVSFEVHLGPAGGAYWGQSGTSEALVITVDP
jgi:hypothetical protein